MYTFNAQVLKIIKYVSKIGTAVDFEFFSAEIYIIALKTDKDKLFDF